jgi:hypothetical protein
MYATADHDDVADVNVLRAPGPYRADAIRDLKDKADGDTYDNGVVHLANAPRMSAAGPDRTAGWKARQHDLAVSPKLPSGSRGRPPVPRPEPARLR